MSIQADFLFAVAPMMGGPIFYKKSLDKWKIYAYYIDS